LLTQLKNIHTQVRATTAELAGILSETNPDLQALARTRMKLTRQAGHWRTFLQCQILPALDSLGPAQAAQVADLRRGAAEFAIKKSAHIAHWSSRAAESNIAGYRRASADMRSSLLARIEREAAILYPLLE